MYKRLLYNMPVVFTDCIVKTVRTRRYKKRRIDKKWLKRYGYKEVPDNDKVVLFQDQIFMTEKCYDRLVRCLCKKEKESDLHG